jgi:pseudouridine-5'-phosphate glycosidase
VTVIVSDDVAMAVAGGRPVVALETSVVGQGLPVPHNQECVERMSTAIAEHGAVAAWTGLVDGAVIVGLDQAQLDRFATSGAAIKVARRDMPFALAMGQLGATTVSATIWAAARAGIPIAATGGIGGVHPGERPDVSADLFELATTPVAMVCSGPKSIVDPELTVERLEELGVAVVGYRTGVLPFFLAPDAGVALEHRVEDPASAAAVADAQLRADLPGAVVFCNPVPAEHAMDAGEVRRVTAAAQERLESAGVAGKDVTPFLLATIAELTDGRSITANLHLLEDNARVAGAIAVALSAARSG